MVVVVMGGGLGAAGDTGFGAMVWGGWGGGGV